MSCRPVPKHRCSTGRPDDALEAIEAALLEFAGSDEVFLVAPLLVVGMTAVADLADLGRVFREAARVTKAQEAGVRLIAQARAIGDEASGAAARTPSVRAAIATVEAEATRLAGGSDPDRWITAAASWQEIRMPFQAARAQARAGEAILLVRGARDEATIRLGDAHDSHPSRGRPASDGDRGHRQPRSHRPARRCDGDRTRYAALGADAPPDASRSPAEILGLSAPASGSPRARRRRSLERRDRRGPVHQPEDGQRPCDALLNKLGVNNRVEAATIAVRIQANEPVRDTGSRSASG